MATVAPHPCPSLGSANFLNAGNDRSIWSLLHDGHLSLIGTVTLKYLPYNLLSFELNKPFAFVRNLDAFLANRIGVRIGSGEVWGSNSRQHLSGWIDLLSAGTESFSVIISEVSGQRQTKRSAQQRSYTDH